MRRPLAVLLGGLTVLALCALDLHRNRRRGGYAL